MRTSRNGTKVGRQAAKLYIWVDKASKAKLVYLTDTLCYDSGEPTPRREIMVSFPRKEEQKQIELERTVFFFSFADRGR